MNRSQVIWWRVLVIVILGLMTFGLALVLFPDFAVKVFGLLVYSSFSQLDSFSPEALRYIKLVHAVLGAVMFGWGLLFLFIVLGPLRQRPRDAWRMIVVSLTAWYLSDTAFSLVSGFWQNAVLNTGIVVLFAVPLIGLRLGTQKDSNQ